MGFMRLGEENKNSGALSFPSGFLWASKENGTVQSINFPYNKRPSRAKTWFRPYKSSQTPGRMAIRPYKGLLNRTIQVENPTIQVENPVIHVENCTIQPLNPVIQVENRTIQVENPTIQRNLQKTLKFIDSQPQTVIKITN